MLPRSIRFLAVWVGLAAIAATGSAFSAELDEDCGVLRNHYGPFDYRTASKDKIQLVEDYHFTPPVEQLKRGQSGAFPGTDLDYTLRVFPNHHRALSAMSQLAWRTKSRRAHESGLSIDCWFQRAMQFAPEDGIVYMLYGVDLLRRGATKEALEFLQKSDSLNPDNANTLYNLGLVHFELKNYDRSLEYAKRAYALGFPLAGLRQQLQKRGVWR